MPKQSPAAQLHAVVAHQPAGVGALVPGVGASRPRRRRSGPSRGCGCSGAHPPWARRRACSSVRIPAETATLSPVSVPHQRHEVQDPLQHALVGTADGQHDAELRRTERRGLGCGGQHLVGVEEGRCLHRGVEARRLGAEVAVLGAPSGLRRQDPFDLHRRARTRPGGPRAPVRPGPPPTRRERPPGRPARRARAGGARRASARPAAATAGPGLGPGRARGEDARGRLDGRSEVADGATVGAAEASPGTGTR